MSDTKNQTGARIPRPQQRMVRSPRQRVAHHLMEYGFKLHEDDIHFTNGGSHKRLNDTIECWRVYCQFGNQRVEVTSGSTLTACAAGLVILRNPDNSELYGDFIAEPKKRTPNGALCDGGGETR